MNLISLGLLLLCCLPAFGFALRGIALLSIRQATPGRLVSMSGVVAMISVWVFAGLVPHVCIEFRKIFDEFDLDLPRSTEWIVSFAEWTIRYGLLWYPFAFGLSLLALLVPEIVFYRSHAK